MVSRDAIAAAVEPAAEHIFIAHANALRLRRDVAKLPGAITLDPALAPSVEGNVVWAKFATDVAPHLDAIGHRDHNAQRLTRAWTVPTEEGTFYLQLKSEPDEIRTIQRRQAELFPRAAGDLRASLVLLTWTTGSPRLVALERGVALWHIDIDTLIDSATTEPITPPRRRQVRGRDQRRDERGHETS